MSENTAAPTLLLVDDEPAILSSLRRLLRPAGYTIHVAESGAAGLAILEQEAVDLVISDMRMPEMDGARFLEQVRLRWPEVTRILLTGYADIASTIDAINRGEIYRYISKPWVDSDLTLVIRDALESARLRRENAALLELTRAQNKELAELNAGLEDKVRQRTAEIEQVNSFLNLANDKLKQNFLLSIKVFSNLMELRGSAVAGHSRRVANLSRKLAERMALGPRACQDVFVAALLHDIGRIGFSDEMLAVPVARLYGDELARYRKHPTTGEAALMPLEDLRDAAKLVRWHHERFDGQGFPDGLAGEAIPLGARILAVVNEYDGLQTGNVVDRRMSAEDARAMIVQMRGKRYDPQVVDAFVELMRGVVQEAPTEKAISYLDLQPGMVLARDLVNNDGVLLLSADFVIDAPVLRQLQEYAHREDHSIAIYIRTDAKPGKTS